MCRRLVTGGYGNLIRACCTRPMRTFHRRYVACYMIFRRMRTVKAGKGLSTARNCRYSCSTPIDQSPRRSSGDTPPCHRWKSSASICRLLLDVWLGSRRRRSGVACPLCVCGMKLMYCREICAQHLVAFGKLNAHQSLKKRRLSLGAFLAD